MYPMVPLTTKKKKKKKEMNEKKKLLSQLQLLRKLKGQQRNI